MKVQEKKKKIVVLCSRPPQNVTNKKFHVACGRATTAKKSTAENDDVNPSNRCNSSFSAARTTIHSISGKKTFILLLFIGI